MAMFAEADIPASQWVLRNILPALVGNLLGEMVMVTVLFYNQRDETDDPAERWSHLERFENRRPGKTGNAESLTGSRRVGFAHSVMAFMLPRSGYESRSIGRRRRDAH